MAAALVDGRQFTAADVWRKARLAADANRPRAARQAVGLLDAKQASGLDAALDTPARYLVRSAGSARSRPRRDGDAGADPPVGKRPRGGRRAAARTMGARSAAGPGGMGLGRGRQAGGDQAPARSAQVLPARVRSWPPRPRLPLDWPEDTLAWKARASLRSDGATRWPQVMQAIAAMSAAEQRDPSWVYWRARAMRCAGRRPRGDRQRGPARPGAGAARLDRRPAALLRQPGGRGSGAEDRAAAAPGAADRRRARRRRCSTPGWRARCC